MGFALLVSPSVALEPWTDANFKKAVKEYTQDPAAGKSKYGPISEWDTSAVTKMDYLFCYADQFDEDISKWDVSSVTDMSGMFDNAKKFNQDISKWDVSNVNNMYAMFTYASTFNHNLSGWKIGQVTDMTGMFWEAISFEQKLCWELNSAVRKDWMFFGINAVVSCDS